MVELDKQGAGPLFTLQQHGSCPIFRKHTSQFELEFSLMAQPNNREAVDSTIRKLIEPFNKKGVTISDATTFANDLEFDSLTVMDFVAAIEDDFDIIISMNQQAEIENYGQLVDAVTKSATAS